MLLTLALRLAEASPAPAVVSGGGGDGTSFTDLVPLVTGAGGALVVLLLISYLFITDRITSVKAVTRLREADNNRFNDMVAQRDSLTVNLEKANDTTATATLSAKQALDLLHDFVQNQPPPPPPRKAAVRQPARRT